MKSILFAVSTGFVGIFCVTVLSVVVWGQNPNVVPGVLTTVQPCISYDETFTRQAAVEFLNAPATQPDETVSNNVLFDRKNWAEDIRFSRDVWCLEFQYKPIRTIWYDSPTKNGIEKKLALYMVYSVTNAGKKSAIRTIVDKSIEFPEQKTMQIANCTCSFCVKAGNTEGSRTVEVNTPPTLRNQTGTFKPEEIEMPIQFAPHFLLASDSILKSAKSQVDPVTGNITTEVERTTASFQDKVIPIAIDAISQRERAAKPFESTVSIAGKTIKPNETVWGVVTWVDVDPRINSFSVIVSGLTNAYKWEELKEGEQFAYKKGDPIGSKRTLTPKSLKLNFSRPGDEFEMNERQFRIGIEGALDYEWGYR